MQHKTVFRFIKVSWVVGFAVVFALMLGWALNIVALTQLDFESPYRAEVVRGVGVVVPPAGSILGYLPLDDSPSGEDVSND